MQLRSKLHTSSQDEAAIKSNPLSTDVASEAQEVLEETLWEELQEIKGYKTTKNEKLYMLVFKPPTKNISIDGIVIERKEIDTEYVYNIQSKNKTIPYRNWIRRRILKSFLSQINILKTNERQHHYKWKPPAENRIISYTLPNKFLQEYPTPYKTIASNYYANPHLKYCTPKVEYYCDCSDNNLRCEAQDSCYLRDCCIECTSKCCNLEICQNARFTKRNYVPLKLFRTRCRGFGIKTLVPIKKNQFIIEYVGEVISIEESHIRIDLARKRNDPNFYIFALTKDIVIDAENMGNIARFINHSCNPNCYTEVWLVNNQKRVGVFAKQDIEEGIELTYDYHFQIEPGASNPCYCNSSNCNGFIGKERYY